MHNDHTPARGQQRGGASAGRLVGRQKVLPVSAPLAHRSTPDSCWISFSRFRIWACIDTSRLLTGSSQTRSFGSSASARAIPTGMRAVRRLALGTDSMHGLFGREMIWLVAYGWTPSQALLAGTRNGGELIGDPRAGVLRPGSFADFVVVPADPLTDIDAVGMVSEVYQGGQRVATAG